MFIFDTQQVIMKFLSIALLIGILSVTALNAQVAEETAEPPFIKTIQFIGDTAFGQLPIIRLGTTLNLSFDDIIGDEHDYFYTIKHYNADWTPSKLAKSEYLSGMDNVRILDFENSVSTLQIYTNYRLTIPNQNTRALTKTGNYLVTIFDEEENIVFSRKFMVFSPQFSVGAQVTRSRDMEFINTKQTLRFFIDGGSQLIINPERNLKTVIIQNNNLKNAITGINPQYTLGNKLEYRYDQETAFWGGNEFFNFENKDIRAGTNAIRSIELKSLYHNYLYTNVSRRKQEYTYNPDINGNFTLTTLQGRVTRTEAEYAWIHFSLDYPRLVEGKSIHIYGNFNNYEIDKTTKLEFNERKGIYELPYLLKQGFYNYKFALVNEDDSIDHKNAIGGNYWETENAYQILAYYRKPGGRFDQLLGVGNTNSTNITN